MKLGVNPRLLASRILRALALGSMAPALFAQYLGPEQPVSTALYATSAVLAADLDGDGDQDVLSASLSEGTVAWYESDGKGSFGTLQILTTAAEDAFSVFAADLDGDTDLDALSASSGNNPISWYENLDGRGGFGPEKAFASGFQYGSCVIAADLDGDGDQDVVAASSRDDRIEWYENDGQGSFAAPQVVSTMSHGPTSVVAADFNGDGDLDLLAALGTDSKIAWYENIDGAGAFGPLKEIAIGVLSAHSVFATDLDGDGDQDALSASYLDDKIALYDNTDGHGTFGTQEVITKLANGAWAVFASDLDTDGDQDVLSSSYDDSKFAWYENKYGTGTFGPQQVITSIAPSARAIFAADLDGEGHPDVLAGYFFKVCWYPYTYGLLEDFGVEQAITTKVDGPLSIAGADLDGDGDLDAFGASYGDDKIAWYENTDGLGTFGSQKIISTAGDGATSVCAADFDSDGDADVLASSDLDDKLAWYRNAGAGAFAAAQVITTEADGARSVCAGDFDGDGDLDAASASYYDDTLAWYENLDGSGSFGPPQTLTIAADGANAILAKDLDGDGDLDALAVSAEDDTIAWYENVGAPGSFGPESVISNGADYAFATFAADLDGDGDEDVLSASSLDDTIAWYENLTGAGNYGSERVLAEDVEAARGVHAADLDGDGDQDALSTGLYDDRIVWYANTDGLGAFTAQPALTQTAAGANAIIAADLDSDGDQDVLAIPAYTRVTWYENLHLGVALSYGCGGNPPGSLSVLSGVAKLGTTLTLGVDNPLGTQGSASIPFLALSATSDPAFPCGAMIPGLGMSGAGGAGELLLGLASGPLRILTAGELWVGPDHPVPFHVGIPASVTLLGAAVFAQGLILDPAPGAPVTLGLTNGLGLKLGSGKP